MKIINYVIVAPVMVWLWYYDEKGNKHCKELLGIEALRFVDRTAEKEGRPLSEGDPQTMDVESSSQS